VSLVVSTGPSRGRSQRSLLVSVGTASTVGAPGRGVVLKIGSSPALSMVIRTEYRGQRYSMGSSDPLPAGFEIWFRSLNFQATGNGYLMRITNRDELRAWRQAGADPASVAAAARAPATAQVDAAGPSAPRRRRRSSQRSQQARTEH
jgi:hypothetical protein